MLKSEDLKAEVKRILICHHPMRYLRKVLDLALIALCWDGKVGIDHNLNLKAWLHIHHKIIIHVCKHHVKLYREKIWPPPLHNFGGFYPSFSPTSLHFLLFTCHWRWLLQNQQDTLSSEPHTQVHVWGIHCFNQKGEFPLLYWSAPDPRKV